MSEKPTFSMDEWKTCLKVLQIASKDPQAVPELDVFKGLVTKIYKTARKKNRRSAKTQRQQHDIQAKHSTEICQKYLKPSFFTPQIDYVENTQENTSLQVSEKSNSVDNTSPQVSEKSDSVVESAELYKSQQCYICKNKYQLLHFFYHTLCPDCAACNYQKRLQTTDLNGRVAVITGGRIKIGYEASLKMLRDGAEVITTTRFPKDAALRYANETDFSQWQQRLHIYQLDLRNINQIEMFIDFIYQNYSSIDIVINNAAQTIKRPVEFYQEIIEIERTALENSQIQKLICSPQNTPQLSMQQNLPATLNAMFPKGQYDEDGQQLDLRKRNSWVLDITKVTPLEFVEAYFITTLAPFMLNSRLKKLLKKSKFQERFIVNVSAMEGQFNRAYKTPFHPHTNMAKAAMNMMTRTCAQQYALENIYMNSVDTGWVTDENPFPKKSRIKKRGFVPPLDCIDGAARLYDPIVQGIAGKIIYGKFLKDYAPYKW